MNDPERRALTETIKEIVGRGEPAYAVADRDLVGGAIAVIVRDPTDELVPRLIVFGAPSLTDEVVARARGALMQSEVAEPRLSRRRVITLWVDGRYEVREAERTAVGQREGQTPSPPNGAAERLRTAAARAVAVSVPGVGSVRLVISRE